MTVYYKMRQFLLQNMSAFLLRNTTVLLQNVFKKCDDFIAKCDSYYKTPLLLQVATVET